MPWYDTFDALAAARLPRLEILREEPMSRHTTFRIGGPARHGGGTGGTVGCCGTGGLAHTAAGQRL